MPTSAKRSCATAIQRHPLLPCACLFYLHILRGIATGRTTRDLRCRHYGVYLRFCTYNSSAESSSFYTPNAYCGDIYATCNMYAGLIAYACGNLAYRALSRRCRVRKIGGAAGEVKKAATNVRGRGARRCHALRCHLRGNGRLNGVAVMVATRTETDG